MQKILPNYTYQRDANDTSKIEIEVFIGLLYFVNELRASHLNLYDLRLTGGIEVGLFHNCMNLQRFKLLIRAIRFDDATTGNLLKEYQKFSPIRF